MLKSLFWKERFNRNDSIVKIAFMYSVLIIMAFIAIFPILYIFSVSIAPGQSIFKSTFKFIPDNATLEHFEDILFKSDFLIWIKNSLFVSIVATVITLVASVTAAYAFSRYQFKGKGVIMTTFLLTRMFPAPMLLLPIFKILMNFDWLNTYKGLIIPYVATAVPFCVWTLKGFFDTVPLSIEESAYMDGASLSRIFINIVLPLSLPALGIASLFAFTAAWNEYVVASIVITDTSLKTLPVGVTGLQDALSTPWGLLSAASLLTAIPVMILFIGLSKFMVSGLTLGGVKG